MALDVKAKAINDATHQILGPLKQIRDLSAKVNDELADGVTPHADTQALIKAEAGGLKSAWEAGRDALDAAFLLP